MAYDYTSGYHGALGRAAQAQASQSRADFQREAKDNPYYKTLSMLEPVADVADVGLSFARLPPVAGEATRGLKNIAGGLAGVDEEGVEEGVSGLASAGASFMKWKAQKDKKAQEDGVMKGFEELLRKHGRGEEGTPEKSASPKPEDVSRSSVDELIDLIVSRRT